MHENTDNGDQIPKKRNRKRVFERDTSRIADGELLNKSRVWAKLLEQYLPQFQALDPLFDPAYITAWRSALDAFEALPTNEYMEDLQGEKVAEMHLVTDLEYYVRKAFPERKRIEEEFGLHKLRTQGARRGVRDVVIGFATLQRIDYYLAQLLAAGMPAAFTTQFLDALNDYADAEVQHQYSLLESIRATNERVYAFNALYKTHRQVAMAAEAVFDGDEIKINLFR
jgi:hypothetical protein